MEHHITTPLNSKRKPSIGGGVFAKICQRKAAATIRDPGFARLHPLKAAMGGRGWEGPTARVYEGRVKGRDVA
jgi:hypothetical protein